MTINCVVCFIVVGLISYELLHINAYAGEITDSEHRTKAATEKLPTLVCYRCNTMTDEKCLNVHVNSTSYHANCSDDSRICQVKRITMTTITTTGDVTVKPKLWMLQRNCTGTCDPGCIIIGERTKLSSCTTCCEESLCNDGNGATSFNYNKNFELGLFYLFAILLIFIVES